MRISRDSPLPPIESLNGFKLLQDLTVSGSHHALPGQNRDRSVHVSFKLEPCEFPSNELPQMESPLQVLVDEAVRGLCEVLFANKPVPIVGFKIVSIDIAPEPLWDLPPVSCLKAGRAAGQCLIATVSDQLRRAQGSN